MNKFKVGDKVKYKNIETYFVCYEGSGVIIELQNGWKEENILYNYIPENYICRKFSTYYWCFKEDIELVEEELEVNPLYQVGIDYSDYIPKISYLGALTGFPIYQTNKKQTIMNKIEKYVKNLTLSADEKLLRKHGLHDECGNTTDTGMDAIENMIYSKPENQAYLLEIAKGLEAEESKK